MRAEPDDDYEQLRIATTMVGGSSLAIYMGGISLELGRLVEASAAIASPGVYGRLLNLTRTSARVDVITGTSAGGLNGACLALAQARGTDLSVLRNLWVEKGDFNKLLRPIGDAKPPSLLKGDEFFLPSLVEALRALAGEHPSNGPDPESSEAKVRAPKTPLHLQMTIASINGVTRTYVDDFMTRIRNTEHLQWFTFTRDPASPALDRSPSLAVWREHFSTHHHDDFAHAQIADRLALAARSSASFPVAFEPSLVPVGEQGSKQRPDMGGVTSLTRTDHVLDGGVLMNQPVKPALEAIFGMPADQQVRRVLAFVVPDPASQGGSEAELPKDAPAASEVLVKALITLPRAQSLQEELEAIRVHNRRVRTRREARLDLLDALTERDPSRHPGEFFEGLVKSMWPLYRAAHKRRLLELILDEVEVGIGGSMAAAEVELHPRADAWSRTALSAALGEAVEDWTLPMDHVPLGEGLLDIGPGWRWDLTAVDRVGAIVLDLLKWAVWLVALRTPSAPRLGRERMVALRQVQELRARLHERLAVLRVLSKVDRGYWADQAGAVLRAFDDLAVRRPAPGEGQPTSEEPTPLELWAQQAVEGWPGALEDPVRDGSPGPAPTGSGGDEGRGRKPLRMPARMEREAAQARQLLQVLKRSADPGPSGVPVTPAGLFRQQLADHALAIAELLGELYQTFVQMFDSLGAGDAHRLDLEAQVKELLKEAPRALSQDYRKGAERFAVLLKTLVLATPEAHEPLPPRDILKRLLGLQMIQQLTSGEDVIEQALELVQVDANVPSPFPGVRSGVDKLAGAKLAHFGAFYKRSWAANDWMWGRLDGAARLSEIALSPERLVQLGYGPSKAYQAIKCVALHQHTCTCSDGDEGPPPEGSAHLWEQAPGDGQYLKNLWVREQRAIVDELAFLDDPDRPVPPRLPRCAAAVARRLQIEILREELPRLAVEAQLDREGGAARTRAGRGLELLLRLPTPVGGVAGPDRRGQPTPPPESLTAKQLVRALHEYRIGAEDLLEEIGTDHFTTVASHAAVVASATAAAGAKGTALAPVRSAARAVRGTLLALAMFARAAARGSATGFGILVVLLAAGAAITGLAVLTDDLVPLAVATVGTALFWAGVLLALVRAGVTGVLQVVVTAILGYSVLRWHFLQDFPLRLSEPGGQALLLVVLIMAAVALGTVSSPGWPARMRRTVEEMTTEPLQPGTAPRPRAARLLTAVLRVPPTAALIIGLVLAVGTAILFEVQVWSDLEPPDSGLGTAEDPGMVRLQLASGSEASARILVRWSELGALENARNQIQWDWLFLVLLTLGLFLACRGAGGLLRGLGRSDLGRFGAEWSWLVLIAGALDGVENWMLRRMVLEASARPGARGSVLAEQLPAEAPTIAGIAAAAKFVLLGIAVAYLLVALVAFGRWWFSRPRRTELPGS